METVQEIFEQIDSTTLKILYIRETFKGLSANCIHQENINRVINEQQ